MNRAIIRKEENLVDKIIDMKIETGLDQSKTSDYTKRPTYLFASTTNTIPDYSKPTFNKRYFDSRNYVSTPSYSEPTKYFIAKDNYKHIIKTPVTFVLPFLDIPKLNLEPGLYGDCYYPTNSLRQNATNQDTTGEVDIHENGHYWNSNKTERQNRNWVRTMIPDTYYH